MANWEVVDNTGTGKGFLSLTCDGERVCDFFPFAKAANPAWVRAQAEYICTIMNGAVAAERARCAEIARSMDGDHIANAIEMGALMMPTDTGNMT